MRSNNNISKYNNDEEYYLFKMTLWQAPSYVIINSFNPGSTPLGSHYY